MAEQFQSLYRRYRPQRFSDVRGQGHVVLGLRNAVRDERVAHAYLFSGPRGTGKTSTARILAKALNCAKPEDGEPCGQCDSCIDIARGASLDVHELDAASNNGVDAMRDLVARASLATPGKWKVYIVDEVHMLSTAASNALLKTLEEPPAHVVFVLATTDPQKVLPTIRSRTQHFEFHLLEPATLESLLTDIADDAHLELPSDGIEAAVRRAHGSARDALSALDLVVAAGVVEDDDRFVRDLVRAIAERDTHLALHSVEEAMVAGFDAGRLATELVEGLRAQFLSAMAPELPRHGTLTTGHESGEPLLGPARCVRALEVIGAAIVDMRESLDARTTFEVALVRLTHPEVDDGPAAILERIERLERRLQELAGAVPAPAVSAPAVPPHAAPAHAAPAPAAPTPTAPPPPVPTLTAPTGPVPGSSPALGAYLQPSPAPAPVAAVEEETATASVVEEREPAPEPSADPATSSPIVSTPTRDDLVLAWGDHVLASLRPRARAVYNAGRFLSVDDRVVIFALPNSAHVEHATPLVDEVAEALSRHVGTTLTLRLVTEADAGLASPPLPISQGAPPPPPRRTPAGAEGVAVPAGGATADGETAVLDVEEELSDYAELSAEGVSGPHDSLSWAEGRLLEAFPGAEEVQ